MARALQDGADAAAAQLQVRPLKGGTVFWVTVLPTFTGVLLQLVQGTLQDCWRR